MLMFEYFGEALSAYLKITFILEDSLRLKKQDSEKKSLTEKVPQTSHSNKFMQFFTSLKLLYFWTKISSRRPFYFRMTLVFFCGISQGWYRVSLQTQMLQAFYPDQVGCHRHRPPPFWSILFLNLILITSSLYWKYRRPSFGAAEWEVLQFIVHISICTKVHFILDLTEYFLYNVQSLFELKIRMQTL